MSIVDVGNEGYLLDQIDTLEAEVELNQRHIMALQEAAVTRETWLKNTEAEVERLHKHGSEINSELLDVRIKHVGEKDELRREIERLKADPRLALTRHNLKVIQDALAYRFPQHGPTQGLVDAALAALAGEGEEDE